MKNTSIDIIKKLRESGYKAYWAGGCVRDMLLGIKPKDIDIVTSAKPEDIEKILDPIIPVGKEFGVLLTIQNGHRFEIATFRSDIGVKDGRRPESVKFVDEKEDALRRDFTINGMFYDPIEDKIIDYVGGQKDMKDKIVRFIGDPEQRILEDHLRILRAVRFKNNYNLQYHPDTYKSIKKHAHLLKKISSERIRDELNKMIMGEKPSQSFEGMFELGILEHIIPELCLLKGLAQPYMFHTEGDVWDHTMRAINSVTDEESDPNPLREKSPTIALKWAVLMHDIGKYETFKIDKDRIKYNSHSEVGADIASKILKRLKFSAQDVSKVNWLIRHHMIVVPLFKMPKGRRRHWFLMPHFEDLLEVFRADSMGIVPTIMKDYERMLKLYRHEIAVIKLMPKSLVNGEEIMKLLKIKPGKKIGQILKKIREKQLAGTIKNKKEALEIARKLY